MPEYLNQLFDMLAGLPGMNWYVVIILVLLVTGVGVPISEEIVTVGAGVLVHRGLMGEDRLEAFCYAWLACYFGILAADYIVVFIGRHFGKAILHRRWVKRFLHPRRLLWARHQVHEHGAWVIVAARFIPGARWPTLLVAGLMHYPRWRYFLADASSAIVTITIQMAAGYYLAEVTETQFHTTEGWMTLGMFIAGVSLLTAYILWYRKYRRTHGPIRLGKFRKRRTTTGK